MNSRRLITCAASAVLLGGLVAGPVARAGASAPRLTQTGTLVGRLAYVTKGNDVDIATVTTTGVEGKPSKVGPITVLKSGQSVRISGFVASGDGAFLAWDENVFSDHGRHFVKSTVVEYDVLDKSLHPLKNNSAAGVVDFAGDSLVISDNGVTKQLVLQPTTHLVKVKDAQSPIGTYPGGVVDTVTHFRPHSSTHTDVLRLTSFAGSHRVLHTYTLRGNQYDDPDESWSSSDGKHLVIERGNHQDFGGLGPSSLADEFALTGSHHRSQLGHFGTAKQSWRIASVSFAGAGDNVWAAWERATRTGAVGVVAAYSHGAWKRVAANAIAVAGNPAGYVVVQLGKFVVVKPAVADQMTTVPTSHAYLQHGGVVTVLPLSGNAFAWVNTPA